MDLTKQEFDVLIEALEAWENKDESKDLLESILSASLSRSPEELARVEQHQQPNKMRRKQEARFRKERSILLRAKLITMRDSQEADEIFKPDVQRG